MPMSQQQLSAKGGEMTHLRAHERKTKALELRKKGASYSQIAKLADYASAGAAHNAVRSLRTELEGETAREATQLENDRLDSYLIGLGPALKSNDHKTVIAATGAAVKISERRAKMLGLDDYEARKIAVEERQVAVNEQVATMLGVAMANWITKMELPEEYQQRAIDAAEDELKQIGA